MDETRSGGVSSRNQLEGTEKERPQGGRRGVWPKALVVLLLLAAIVAVVLVKQSGKRRAEHGSARSTAIQFSPDEILATVNAATMTLAELENQLSSLLEEFRSEYAGVKHEFLEELIIRKLLAQEAVRLNVAESAAYKEAYSEHDAHPGHEEEALVRALLKTQVFDQIRVSEEEVRDFYDNNKGALPAGLDFDTNKENLRDLVVQKKQEEATNKYISDLKQKAQITRNQRWIEAQLALFADNPLDKALKTGRPVVADFGRGTCIPCKMMKPILEDLAKEYRGKAEILIIQIDEYAFVTRRCGIRVIPTQIFYDSSANEVYRHQGFMPKEDIREQLAKLGVK